MSETVVFQASGELMQGFLGNIIYETVLPKTIQELEIEVSFEKREKEAVTDTDCEAYKQAWFLNTGKMPEEEEIRQMIASQKTEINVSVYHNGVQLGCAHRDEMTKRIVIGPGRISEGFRPWKIDGGVLRVALHVFQLLNDHTPYRIIVKGRTPYGQ